MLKGVLAIVKSWTFSAMFAGISTVVDRPVMISIDFGENPFLICSCILSLVLSEYENEAKSPDARYIM